MDLAELIRSRRTHKAYAPAPVDRAILDECTVYDVELPGGAGHGLLIWLDVGYPDRRVIAVTLAPHEQAA